ncbi:MAG: response regulator containing a CheY-like receiver domain and an HTH DNA-binding domain [Bacteroidetes bacterium]|nr:MAG: response regulator containing a CheY-like receiver domain and an HTH DNA-binding domain [Bacteroidota bacterium]
MKRNLPAGLEASIEVYRSGEDVRVLVNGNRIDYLELPCILREPFQAELIADQPAIDCIKLQMRIADPDQIEKKFVGCRYGALDTAPDLVGNKTVRDCPHCDIISSCPGFDIVCKVPPAPNGHITRQEYLVIRLISQGKLDKEIASELSIEVCTVRTYLARIREKLCINNRIEIAFWAMQKGI